MPPNTVEFNVKFTIDQASAAQAEAVAKRIEKMGGTGSPLITRFVGDTKDFEKATRSISAMEGAVANIGRRMSPGRMSIAQQAIDMARVLGITTKQLSQVIKVFDIGNEGAGAFVRTLQDMGVPLGDAYHALRLTETSLAGHGKHINRDVAAYKRLVAEAVAYEQTTRKSAGRGAASVLGTAPRSRPMATVFAQDQAELKKTEASVKSLDAAIQRMGTNMSKSRIALAQTAVDLSKKLGITTKQLSVLSDMVRGSKEKGGPSGKDLLKAFEGMGIPADKVRATIAAMEPLLGKSSRSINRAVNEYKKLVAEGVRFEQESKKSGKNMKDIETSAGATNNIMGQMALLFGGMALSQFGKSLLAPMAKFTEYAGNTMLSSASQLKSQRIIERSVIRIGNVFTTQVAPVVEKLASFAERVAAVFERYPALGKAVAFGAVGALVTGTLLTTLGQIISLMTAFRFLGGKELLDSLSPRLRTVSGAARTGVAALGGTSAVLSGIGLAAILLQVAPQWGLAVGNAINVKLGRKEESGAQVAQTALRIPLLFSLDYLNFLQKANDRFGILGSTLDKLWQASGRNILRIDAWISKILKLTNTQDEALDRLGPSSAAVQAFIDYNKQEVESDLQTAKQRVAIVQAANAALIASDRSYAKAVAQLQSSYADQSTSIAMQGYQANLDAERNYYADRARLLRDANIDIRRIEEDLQENLRRMKRDHNRNIAELEGERDALGIVAENERYQDERDDAIRAANIEIARRREDLAIRLADMAAAFQAEQMQRRQQAAQQMLEARNNFEKQMEDLALAHEEENKQIAADKALKLAELDKVANEERIKRRNAFNDQLRDLDAALLDEYNLKDAYYQQMAKDLEAWIKQWNGIMGSNLPGYPTGIGPYDGGYIKQGWNFLHSGEYVMPASVVAMAERSMRGSLSNTSLMNMFSGGGSRAVHIHQENRFYGQASGMDRREIEAAIDNGIALALEAA